MSFKEWLKEADEPVVVPDAPINIFFNNLDEVTQKKVMESLMASLNITQDDEYSNKKIIDALAKDPLVTISGKDVTQKIKFEV